MWGNADKCEVYVNGKRLLQLRFYCCFLYFIRKMVVWTFGTRCLNAGPPLVWYQMHIL
jgi:hypothetical protein